MWQEYGMILAQTNDGAALRLNRCRVHSQDEQNPGFSGQDSHEHPSIIRVRQLASYTLSNDQLDLLKFKRRQH